MVRRGAVCIRRIYGTQTKIVIKINVYFKFFVVKNDGNFLVTYVRVQLCCSKFRTILIFEKLKTLSLKLKPVHDLALLKIVVLLVPGGYSCPVMVLKIVRGVCSCTSTNQYAGCSDNTSSLVAP